jgi:hypothetical protein
MGCQHICCQETYHWHQSNLRHVKDGTFHLGTGLSSVERKEDLSLVSTDHEVNFLKALASISLYRGGDRLLYANMVAM